MTKADSLSIEYPAREDDTCPSRAPFRVESPAGAFIVTADGQRLGAYLLRESVSTARRRGWRTIIGTPGAGARLTSVRAGIQWIHVFPSGWAEEAERLAR